MRRVPPRVAALASRSLRSGTPGDDAASQAPGDVFRQRCEALGSRLTPLVGWEGFRALLFRALARAKRDLPCLGGVELDTTGSPSELEEVLSRQGPGEAEAGRAAVLGHLLGLLNAVVGAELTRQIVGSAWPDLLVKNADFEVEEDEG